MNTLKITIPEGHVVDKFDEIKGELSFKLAPKDPKQKLNYFSDILAFHSHTEESFSTWCESLRPHEKGQRKEELIVAAYNGRQLDDPLPDFEDGEPKYAPYFKMPDRSGAGFSFISYGGWRARSGVSARQLFSGPEAYENMLDAVKKYLPEYQESRTL